MNEFNLPKEYKWEQAHTKIDTTTYVQALTDAETLSYLGQVPPKPGIFLFGQNTGVVEVHVSTYDSATSAIVWTQLF